MDVLLKNGLFPRFTKPCWVPKRGHFMCNKREPYGLKIGRNLITGSDVEFYHWVLIESDPRIVWYCEQPVKMMSLIDEKNRGSYIDMYILWNDGKEVFRELKTQKDMKLIESNIKLRRQIDIQKSWCERHVIKHEIVTDAEIFANTVLLDNWHSILTELNNYKSVDLSKVIVLINEYIQCIAVSTINDIAKHLNKYSINCVRAGIFRMIHAGQLTAPLHEVVLTNSMSVMSAHYVK